ncbi:MAG: transposase [Methylobacter sp.]|nr:transposase [Methylobacter sp.]
MYNKPLPGLCFLNLSLLSVETRTAYPLITEQLVRGDVQTSAPKAVTPKNAKPGRPKGSVNKNRKAVELSPFQRQLQACIKAALTLIGLDLGIVYFVYDGALGNNAGLQTVKQAGLHLICKLRHDSKLYFPYTGEYSGKGKPRKYGEKLTLETLTDEQRKSETVEKGIRTCTYQVHVWHKNFPELLNVAIIVKTNLKTGRTEKVLLFSDDLTLASETLISDYSLRFQIEFNFRDAKQYWGLEDFMNVKETQVNNAANFSLFMVTFSQLLSAKIEGINKGSMLDLKTIFRARKYTRRIINSLGKNDDTFLIDDRIFQAAEIGRIHGRAA